MVCGDKTLFFFLIHGPIPRSGTGVADPEPRRGRLFKNFKSGQVASLNWELGTQLKLGGERIDWC